MTNFNRQMFPAIITIVLMASSACVPKNQNGTDTQGTSNASSSSEVVVTTGSEDESWAYGRYYQPVSNSEEVLFKPTMEIRPDHTAVLELEFCGEEMKFSQVVGWRSVDPQTIEFSSTSEDIAFTWFDNTPFGVVRMHSTDDPEIVIVSDAALDHGVTLGKFRRGEGCLVPGENGCRSGGYVFPCQK